MKRFLYLLGLLISLESFAQPRFKTENVILITLDGMRWQEVFGGAEARLINKEFVKDSMAVIRDFWASSAEKRREKLMPFFWSTISKQGQLYGNRTLGNFVNVTNNQWFSYPGYSELLCGFADDQRITSNDKVYNPNKTVFEFINGKAPFKGKVAAYSSWDVFPFILNAQRSGIPVNSGIIPVKVPNAKERVLNELMVEVPNPLGDVRLDAFTFHYGWEYMKRNRPRLIMMGFDETDDFAHGGHYDLYLHSANNTDLMIKSLWDWCQTDEFYKGKTTLIVTCDHGRGGTHVGDWRHHGKETPDSDQTWIAVIGPDTPALGELKTRGQVYHNQIAKTLSRLLGYDYENIVPVGDEIKLMTGRNE